MSKFKAFTFYKSDGTKQVLYGSNPQDAMNGAEWDLDYVVTNIRDYREGFDNSMVFINGQWYQNEPQDENKSIVDIVIHNYNQN